MFSFLGDFIRSAGRALDVILLDEDGLDAPRRYRVRPGNVLALAGGVALVLGLFMLLLVVTTPLRGLFPGLATTEMRGEARLNAYRLQALEDSLNSQVAYMDHLRDLMMGRVPAGDGTDPATSDPDTRGLPPVPVDPTSADWEDHQQPALNMGQLALEGGALPIVDLSAMVAVAGPRFPVQPPVEGFMTRGFDPRIGHYAMDIAVSEGTPVRSVVAGYVVMADWTHDGGYVVAVQHAGGYLSVYKHNQRLLKRVGDRVAARESIAMSGNTGEVTTGPHLHFELWRDGLAQDPSDFLLAL